MTLRNENTSLKVKEQSRLETRRELEPEENVERGALKNLRLKAARTLKGLSQSDLAHAVGVTRQTIGLIEAGGYNPTLNLCIAICRTLDCTLDDLFWPDGEKE